MRLGLTLGVNRLQRPSTAPAIPLTWDGDTADTTPDFTLTDYTHPMVGDRVTLNLYSTYSSGVLSGLVDTAYYDLLLADIATDPATINIGIGAQAYGVYYSQAVVTRGAAVIFRSNVETVTLSSPYTQTRVTFSGAPYFSYTPDASFTATKFFTISFWMDIAGTDTTARNILAHASRLTITREITTGKLSWDLRDTANAALWISKSDGQFLTADSLRHIAIAYRADTGVGQFYVNGSSAARTDTTAPQTSANNLHWNRGILSALFGSGSPFNGQIGDFWLTNEFVDLSANIGLFYNGGTPPDISAVHATLGLSHAPLVFFGNTQSAADWNAGTNLGIATSTFTMTGGSVT